MQTRYRIGLIGTAALLGFGCTMLPIQNTPISTKGSLQISLNGVERSTQARLTDIDHILFTLESAKSAPATASIFYTNGVPTSSFATFKDLWPGDATISAAVYGVNPIRTQSLHTQSLLEVIGSANATASVVSGVVTQVPMSLKLNNTQTQGGEIAVNLGLQAGDVNYKALNYKVTTLAGSTPAGSDNGMTTAAKFNEPWGIALSPSGDLYVADSINNMIRKITPEGMVTTFAGNPTAGSSNGTGTAASFNYPTEIACSSNGDLYVADSYNFLIRKITPDQVVTTFAGTGAEGTVNGTGTSASFACLQGLAIDKDGNLFVADTTRHKIRKITPDRVVTTYAGNGTAGLVDGTGTAARFSSPYGLAVDTIGNVYVADVSYNRIRKITPDRVVTTIAGNPNGTWEDGPATGAHFGCLRGLEVDTRGNLYIADQGYNMIRKITPDGMITTVAGSYVYGTTDGAVSIASFKWPNDLIIDRRDNIYVTDLANHKIRKISY